MPITRVKRMNPGRLTQNRVARSCGRTASKPSRSASSKVTTNSKRDHPVCPNVLNRNFMIEKPNAVWVSDITYVWTFEGWLYVAAILDLFSRGIVGLAMDKTIADTLTTQAIRQAILRGEARPGRPDLPYGPRQPVCRE